MVSDSVYRAALVNLELERAKREQLERHVATQDVMMRFICSRINQLETERTILIRKIANVDLPTPAIVPTPAAPDVAPTPAAAQDMIRGLGGAALFEDMGDEAAREHGVSWDKNGRVRYADDNDERHEPQ